MDDVELNTTKRKIKTAEKPKRQSLTHHAKSEDTALVATPIAMNKIHKIQQKRESAFILLRSYMGSRFKTNTFTIESEIKLVRNKKTPRSGP